MSQSYSAPSVRQLAAVVERVAPRDPARWDTREKAPGAGGIPVQVSAERGRQLHMVVGMWDQAVSHSEPEQFPTASAADLFQPQVLRRFWALAVAGGLRHWEKDVGKPLPLPTRKIVRSCLRILAGLVVPGQRVELPSLEGVELKPAVDSRHLVALYRELVDLAGGGPLERGRRGITAQDRARLLALVSVVLDTGARRGELAAMDVTDLADDLSWVRVVRRGQNQGELPLEEVAYRLEVSVRTVRRVVAGQPGTHVSEQLRQEILRELEAVAAEDPRVERYALREGTRVALRRWLTVREGLVSGVGPVTGVAGGLEGGKSALWVTVFPSKAGPPGVRIRAQGLSQSYARGIAAVNFVMAGQSGWEPLPVRMEQLRRAVDAEPLLDEDAAV